MLRSLYESLQLSLRSIGSYRLRTFLTMMGISIGIFAITFIFTLVNTLEHAVSKNLSELGNTVFFVHNWPWRDNSQDWYKYFNRPKVSYEDYQKLKANLHNVVGVSYEVTRPGATAKAGTRSVENVTLCGITYDYLVTDNVKVQDGRYFSNIEIEAGRPVAVIGANVADNLFPNGNALGQEIQVARGQKAKRLKVVGVMEREGVSLLGGSADDVVLIPFRVSATLINLNARGTEKLIAVRAENYSQLDAVEGETIGLVRQARGLKPGMEDNFSINKQEMLMNSLQQVFNVLNSGGVFISAFSLLVGGFGIATIMFSSVKERTSEIGVQKALGATRGFILSQFLIESILLCVTGGAIGIGLMVGISAIAQYVLDSMGTQVEVVVLSKDLAIGMIISLLIGLGAGFLPALLAARLDPVEAMRRQ